MFRTSVVLTLLLAGPAWISPANAQLPLSPNDVPRIAPEFDNHARKSLSCDVEVWNPTLDFALRFVAGYVVHCRLNQFEGKPATVVSYLRVTPEDGESRLFGSARRIPEIPPEMQRSLGKPGKLKNEIAFSGAFALGPGRYRVDLLVTDNRHRTCRKHWKIHAQLNHSQRSVRLSVEPSAVETLDRHAWQIVSPQDRGGLRLTILLDAAPMNPYQSRLHAWDRAFLLESIYSLLRQTPHQSVRLVAFNLDQQRELFRAERFDNQALESLSKSLQEAETASISVQALKNRNSSEFLISLANQELAVPDSPDAIIFLGPNARLDARTTSAALTEKKPTSPPLFYFEYYPWMGGDFPDAIQWLMKAAEGRTFQIHSPAQLDDSIHKMLTELKQE